MTKLDDRTIAKMDVVLEETCRIVPNGGDNKVRTYIAQKLKISAKRGNATLDGLSAVAQSALQELMKRNSAYPPRISANDDLAGLAILSCTHALEALDAALESADAKAARELIGKAKRHLLVLRTRAARLMFSDDQSPQNHTKSREFFDLRD
jgi:hypothetical protein